MPDDGTTRERHLLAVDPGLTTGLAVWDIPQYEDELKGPRATELDVEQLYRLLTQLLLEGAYTYTVVCEAYTISERTMKNTRQNWSLEIIGVLKYMCWLRGHIFAPLQSASAAKSFATNERLKGCGWYIPGRGHSNDALRHLLLFSVKEKIVTL